MIITSLAVVLLLRVYCVLWVRVLLMIDSNPLSDVNIVIVVKLLRSDWSPLTLYGHIKTAEQRTTIHSIRWLVHWPLMGGLLHLVQRGGAWAGAQSLLAVPNVTAHPSTASVLTSYYLMWHYNIFDSKGLISALFVLFINCRIVSVVLYFLSYTYTSCETDIFASTKKVMYSS